MMTETERKEMQEEINRLRLQNHALRVRAAKAESRKAPTVASEIAVRKVAKGPGMAEQLDHAKFEIERIIRRREQLDGHAFSGTGNGLSMHLKVHVYVGPRLQMIRTYGNGVVDYLLADDLRASFGDRFLGLEAFLD